MADKKYGMEIRILALIQRVKKLYSGLKKELQKRIKVDNIFMEWPSRPISDVKMFGNYL